MKSQNFSSQRLYDAYDNYKETSVTNKRIDFDILKPFIEKYKENAKFSVKKIGESLEKRDIFLISIGSGPINILAWSQMHGDESTATMALLDILKFFDSDDEFNFIREEILKNATVHLIPMLNPDGAERFRRRNALDIDLNRDALRLQFPESQALKSIRDSLDADFGFNLHDQDLRYTAGETYKSATISFLAPAFNFEKDINTVRANTMKTIVNLYDELSKFIPGHIARYDDAFEPRAFGDNFVKWGTSSILIESGGWKNNFEKQFIRKMNFIALLVGFQSIATKDYENADISRYNQIPENERNLFDLLLRNATIIYDDKKFIIDIGINHRERPTDDHRDDYFYGSVEEVGDLSTFFGYDELDCTGLTIKEAKSYEDTLDSIDDLRKMDVDKLLTEGFTSVRVKNISDTTNYTDIPLYILGEESKYKSEIGLGNKADFLIYRGDDLLYAIVNGFLYDTKSRMNKIQNGLILR